MAGFRIDQFSGELPLLNDRKLPDAAASATQNCDLVASDLRAFRMPVLVGTAANTTDIMGAFVFNADQMLTFSADVDATYGPIQAASEVKNRVFIGKGFANYPTYTTKEMGLPNPAEPYHGQPIAWRKLGVPAPATKAILALSAVPSGNILQIFVADGRAYCLTQTDHDLSDGDKVLIGGLNEDWSDVRGNVFKIEPHVDSNKFYLKNYDPTPHAGAAYTISGAGTWTQQFNAEDIDDRLYVYTYVTDLGEEGPPSDPSTLVSPFRTQTVTVTTPTSPTIDGVIVQFKRIYRTVASSAGTADYYFVTEMPVTQADFVDTIDPIQLGEPLPSLEWDKPPAGLVGLTVLPNGVMAGFVDRTLYLSEPYQPHAWPSSYTKAMDSKIVGLAAFGQSLVVATEEYPYVGTATDPLSMTFSKIDTMEPCISKRCIKSMGYGVVYPSPNGLILVTPGNTKNVLQDIWGEKEWRELFDGKETYAEVHDGKYFLFSNNSGFIFDPTSDTLEISWIYITDNITALMVDRDEGRLFYSRSDATSRKIFEWHPDSSGSRLPATWASKTFVMPYPVNLGAFQLFFDETGADVTVKFYADGVLKHTATVGNQNPQRLPSGFLAREWKVEITTTVEVQALYVTETIPELRGAFSR